MNEKVKIYFEDLEEKNLRKINNIIVRDGDRVVQGDAKFVPNARRCVYSFTVDDTPYIGKYASPDLPLYLHEIASSEMFNDLGMTTPPHYPIRIKVSPTHSKLGLLSQDINYLDDLIIQPADKITFFQSLPIKPQFGGYRNLSPWHIFTDKDVKAKCLEIMTEECYENVMNYFLLEELRSSCDSHKGNYFFYKRKDAEKFEGIIPIDLESSIALGYEHIDKDSFNYFLHSICYPSCLPFKNWNDIGQDGNFSHYIYTKSFADRIDMLKHLIHTGTLSESQIELLKNAINYDFPGLVKDTCEKYHHHIKEKSRNYTIDTISRLWEYNHNQLDKELQ